MYINLVRIKTSASISNSKYCTGHHKELLWCSWLLLRKFYPLCNIFSMNKIKKCGTTTTTFKHTSVTTVFATQIFLITWRSWILVLVLSQAAGSTSVEKVNTPVCWGQQLPTIDYVLYSNHRLLTFWCMQTNSHLIMGPSTFKWVLASAIPTMCHLTKIYKNLIKTVWFIENNLESWIE